VTGAARGQGRAIACRLADAGCRVIAGDVLAEVATLEQELGDRVVATNLDVTDAASWQHTLDAGVSRFGRLDIVVNNAGILRRAAIDDETEADFVRLWRVNCLGPFLGVQAALSHLRRAGGGAVVNTISTAGLTAWSGHAAYTSAKWALRGLTKVMALELAADQIRVNAIFPGPVLTPMVVTDDDPGAATWLARTPLGRAGLPSDIAELVLFLVSDQSSFITGGEFVIDGGQTIGTLLRTRPSGE